MVPWTNPDPKTAQNSVARLYKACHEALLREVKKLYHRREARLTATSRRHPPQQPWLGGDVGRVERGRRRALPTLRPAWMVAGGDMKDEVADFMAWLESSEDTAAPPQPVVNTDPLLARVPVARPELTQADIDRWMDKYYPEWDWQDDAVTDAQLDYLRSLLRREGLF